MNTYIFSNDKKQSAIFATNNQSSTFEQRFWRSVAQLQDDSRWLCFVSPKELPNKKYLESHGINIKRLLVVHCHDSYSTLSSTLKALKHGKCAAVVTWSTHLSSQQQSEIQFASQCGEAHSLFIKTERMTHTLSCVA